MSRWSPARSPETVSFRPAGQRDLLRVAAMYGADERGFQAMGMTNVELPPAPGLEQLSRWAAEGLLHVGVLTGEESPVAFLHLTIIDGHLHVLQAVTGSKGSAPSTGERLLAHAEQLAGNRGDELLSMTTFLDVAWKGPRYARLGWRVVPPAEQGPELAAVRLDEVVRGLDDWRARAAMVKPL